MPKSPTPTTIAAWLAWAKQTISPLDAELLALHAFAPNLSDRSWLITHLDQSLSPTTAKLGRDLVRRRATGVPLAYLIGEKEFYGRRFKVRPGALIPRPETETLIDLAKTLPLPAAPTILEIGTGSGCIAITLALEFPQARLTATDVSLDALAVAQENNFIFEGRVALVHTDLFTHLRPASHCPTDLIIANLPYVSPDWDWLDPRTLEYEPTTAIYAPGQNGLSLYHRFFRELGEYLTLTPVHFLIIEADPCQHRDLVQIARIFGWKNREIRGFGLVFERQNP